MDVIKHWITQQLTELVGFEDEVTNMMVINYLEDVSSGIWRAWIYLSIGC